MLDTRCGQPLDAHRAEFRGRSPSSHTRVHRTINGGHHNFSHSVADSSPNGTPKPQLPNPHCQIPITTDRPHPTPIILMA
jgi:hypothetical protein